MKNIIEFYYNLSPENIKQKIIITISIQIIITISLKNIILT